jgi:nucleoside-diphosphate-sugar epimerase
MKVLVTGDKGFIATKLQEKLKKTFKEIEIYGFDEDDYYEGFHLNLEGEHFDYVFHLAAIARTVDCTEDPFVRSFESNIALTNFILEYIDYDHLIYSSSCALYGNQNNLNLPISEKNLPNPPSIYAAQKLYSENLIHFYCQDRKKVSVCLRLFNTYGPGQSQLGSYPNVIASLVKKMKEKCYVEITGDGNQTRDFVYVDDVVNAFILSMRKESGNHIYNVCSGVETSINQIASYMTKTIRYIPARPFDIHRQVASNMKIKSELGWIPEFSLEDGIKITLDYEFGSENK